MSINVPVINIGSPDWSLRLADVGGA